MPDRNKIAPMVWNIVKQNETTTDVLIYDDIAKKRTKDWWTDEETGTEVTPNSFKADLDKVETKNICVRINSAGGDVFAAEAIRTAIKDKREEGKIISCRIDAICASAAVGIAMACEKISISSSSWMMIHDPMTFTWGYMNIADCEEALNMLKSIKAGIVNAYTEKTGKDKATIEKLMKDSTWLTGDQAVKEGFCDELLQIEDSGNDNSVQNKFINVVNCLNAANVKNIPVGLLKAVSTHIEEPVVDNKKQIEEKGAEKMPNTEIKTVDELRAAYPGLVKDIENKAVVGERGRIKAIEDNALDGYEEIINKAKFEEPIDAANVALQILAQQKQSGSNFLAGRETDVKNSGMEQVGNASSDETAVDGKKDDIPCIDAINKVLPITK